MDLFNVGIAQVRIVTAKDVEIVAKEMRDSDKDELWDVAHLMPDIALKESFENSKLCWTVTRLNKPVAMFGVGEPNTIWMVATNDFKKLNQKFLKRSKEFIYLMLETYPLLENYVSVNNLVSIAWLKFCGAKMYPPEPYGLNNKMFHKFIFEREYA